MGFYIRKSVSVGPFRFNLSKSGIGISAGVKGLRVGSGPRGNYIHAGRGGLYYRAALPKASPSDRPAPREPETGRMDPNHPVMTEIDSASAATIVDSNSAALLDEIRRKNALMRQWPFVAGVVVLVLCLGFIQEWSAFVLIPTAVVGIFCTCFVYRSDVVQKTTVLLYELDPEVEEAYGRIHDAAQAIADSGALWHIQSAGAVQGDRKYHAGAGTLVTRKRTSVTRSEPPWIKTNVQTVSLWVGRQVLHFLPDRVLIYDGSDVGAVSYVELRAEVQEKRFIETEGVPRDAKVVDRTWKYVNKSGGPDKRFKDNSELPICLYEEVRLTSNTGLNEMVQISRCGPGRAFGVGLEEIGRRLG